MPSRNQTKRRSHSKSRRSASKKSHRRTYDSSKHKRINGKLTHKNQSEVSKTKPNQFNILCWFIANLQYQGKEMVKKGEKMHIPKKGSKQYNGIMKNFYKHYKTANKALMESYARGTLSSASISRIRKNLKLYVKELRKGKEISKEKVLSTLMI